MIFGYSYGKPSFGRTATLENPQFEANKLTSIVIDPANGNGQYLGAAYMNVFDPDADPADQNMMTIGNHPLLVIGTRRVAYLCQRLNINL